MCQCKSKLFPWFCVALVVGVLFVLPARAQTQETPGETIPTQTITPTPTTYPQLVRGEVEIVDENGTPTPNNVFYIRCAPGNTDLDITIEITFLDGAKQLRTERYCNVKFYIVGSISLVQIIGVSSALDTVYRVWLTSVMK